ncbi:hypothetical protein B4113_2903 [Geobacillus sp. B4113_201601]|nr:hypothetical protein B4113_2903 [Geobacillus sp. B4113_201601]
MVHGSVREFPAMKKRVSQAAGPPFSSEIKDMNGGESEQSGLSSRWALRAFFGQ